MGVQNKIQLRHEVEIPLPFTVWSSSASHLDKIVSLPETLLCLKTAAVISTAGGNVGRRFCKARLLSAYPLRPLPNNLEQLLENLVKWGFLVKKSEKSKRKKSLRRTNAERR